jgi:hypothetical protein
MSLQSDFLADVAGKCRLLLVGAGYQVDQMPARDLIRIYFGIIQRRVSSRRRQVHKASSYTVPAHLVAGEAQLINKVLNGDDLWPHQSRKIIKADQEDEMLNDFGIHHFHLGTIPHSKNPRLIQGTKELIFAVVTDQDFFAIGIFDHESWSKRNLLEIIKENWPELMSSSEIEGVKSSGRPHSDDEVAELRKVGMLVPHTLSDGTTYAGPGGGVTLDKRSLAVGRAAMRYMKSVLDLEKRVLSEINKRASVPGGLVTLVWDDKGVPSAIDWRSGISIPLKGRIDLPAL